MRSPRTNAVIMMTITAALWSLGGLLIKSVHLNPVAIAGARSAIAGLVILAALRRPHFSWSGPQIGAALSYVAVVIFFVTATTMTTAANAIMLQFTAPIYVALLGAYILKERNTTLDWVIIAVVLGGMILFFLDQLSPVGLKGNFVAILSGLSFAMFTIFMRMQKDGSPMESVLLGNILTAFVGIPFLISAPPTSADWFYLTILGVVQLGIPYILYSHAIKRLKAIDAVLIPVIEPILNPLWVFIFLDEIPGQWSLIGGAILLCAVTVKCLSAIRRN